MRLVTGIQGNRSQMITTRSREKMYLIGRLLQRGRYHGKYLTVNVAVLSMQHFSHERGKLMQARWMTRYGKNLMGNLQACETIICQEGSKPVQKNKESKKAKEIRESRLKEKEEETRKAEKAKISIFKSEYKAATDLESLTKAFKTLDMAIAKIKTTENLLECLFLKMKILDKTCAKSVKTDGGISESNVKELFLTVREILNYHNNGCAVTTKQKEALSKILLSLGFSNLIPLNGLPPASDAPGTPYATDDSVRFQLRHLGPHLERETTGEYDPDVGFTPDPWQRDFIEAIRLNQSALVVAPTSSGKTFASYYCMKRMMQKSRDGIVVYVSPTKALVNQVAATIYVKFHTESKDGVATVGVFTRDFRVNSLNCRVLVTVPQCLEILLLSPRRYTWAKKIKYVIFDEVHCLKGSLDDTAGVTWERCLLLIRCPFLALSATVRNPKTFHEWLSDMEKFKEAEDQKNGFERWYDSTVRLVVHSGRHSDLVKYTYLKGKGLQHCHPYSHFSPEVLLLHRGIPDGTSMSSREALQLYDSISVHAAERVSGERELKTFFASHSKNGFITYGDVKDFEKVLGEAFFELYKNEPDCYEKVLADLQPAYNITRQDVGYKSCVEGMIDLLASLHEKNMLPAIIFSYNREFIEYLSGLITKHFESITVSKPKHFACGL